jgi:hypothetical protein
MSKTSCRADLAPKEVSAKCNWRSSSHRNCGVLERGIGGGGLGEVETQLVFREKIFPFPFRFSLPTGRIYGEQSVITEWREDQALFGRMQLRIFSFAVGHPIRGAGRWKEEVRITWWLCLL